MEKHFTILFQDNSEVGGFKQHSQQLFKLKQFLKNQTQSYSVRSQHQMNACQQNVLIH